MNHVYHKMEDDLIGMALVLLENEINKNQENFLADAGAEHPDQMLKVFRHLKERWSKAFDLEEKAVVVLEKHAGLSPKQVISVGRVLDRDEVCFLVTYDLGGRAISYESWEVCFTTDSAWEGVGVYAKVTSTIDEFDYQDFEYDLEIIPVVTP